MMKTRFKWFSGALCCTVIAGVVWIAPGAAASEANAASERPNIIHLYTDDQGWGDLGCFDHPYLKTPNFDRLASEGMRLTNFYVNSPICAPSRAAVMSGRFPAAVGFNYRAAREPAREPLDSGRSSRQEQLRGRRPMAA